MNRSKAPLLPELATLRKEQTCGRRKLGVVFGLLFFAFFLVVSCVPSKNDLCCIFVVDLAYVPMCIGLLFSSLPSILVCILFRF